MMLKTGSRIFLSLVLFCSGIFAHAALLPSGDAGQPSVSEQGTHGAISNNVLEGDWAIQDGRLRSFVFKSRMDNSTVQFPEIFALSLKDGSILRAADLQLVGTPKSETLVGDAQASRYSERLAGEQVNFQFTDATGNLHVTWTLLLRDGSSYLRQILTLTAAGQNDIAIRQVRLIDLRVPGIHVVGSVHGSPFVARNMFFGFEHPLSDNSVVNGNAVATMQRELPLKAGQSITYSAVVGVAPAGQMRRMFLHYIERERAHPYRTFLTYNTWYDIGYNDESTETPYDQTEALNRVNAFGEELHVKRGVTLNSYLFDDGWDDHSSLWSFNAGFPNGFTPITKAAAVYGAAPGVWLSPWGGYEKAKEERIEFGKKAGFEIVNGGFALSGPKYYEHFKNVCLEMLHKYGVNQFKFDGTGNDDQVVPGSNFDSDFDAAIHLMGELRKQKPDLFINLTTGTYPSPYWLFYSDSIWRGGDDHSFAGVGPSRERWITYRDAAIYRHVVTAGPLYPLNSLMLHGMIFAQYADGLKSDPHNDFPNEVHSYFGTGTQLQEMYITPALLSPANWDILAEAANWSRKNADVLVDTHWVGGDPAWLEVYGWASWAPRKGILTLRNPSDKSQSITLDIQQVFELPEDAAKKYTARSPWRQDAHKAPITLQAGVPHTFVLTPFQVLTLEAKP
ncbi:MAG TPA: enterotoxin [Acidobacteriaceae bacterium]|jgi:hypothetical protein|nr:enterotoxin [Acidobacteriaceae bacterium]